MAGFAEGFLFFCLLKTQRQHHQVFKPIIIMVAGGKLYLIVLVWSSVYLPVRVGPTAKVQPIELRLQMDLMRECPQVSVGASQTWATPSSVVVQNIVSDVFPYYYYYYY